MIEPAEPGIRKCMCCDWQFVSPDPKRVHRCADCTQKLYHYSPPASGRIQLDGDCYYDPRSREYQ